MSLEEQKLTEKYILGQMDDETRQKFEVRLKNDAKLFDEFSAHLTLFQARKNEISDLVVKAASSEIAASNDSRSPRNVFFFAIAVAAGVVALFIFNGVWSSKAAEGLFKKYYEAPGYIGEVLGPKEDAYKGAFEAYSDGKYEQAMEAFSKLDSLTSVQKNEVAFYGAAARLSLGENDIAIRQFKAICEGRKSDFGPLACYYLGMAYLTDGKKISALETFEKVLAEGDVSKARMQIAERLVEELRRLD